MCLYIHVNRTQAGPEASCRPCRRAPRNASNTLRRRLGGNLCSIGQFLHQGFLYRGLSGADFLGRPFAFGNLTPEELELDQRLDLDKYSS